LGTQNWNRLIETAVDTAALTSSYRDKS
jgi:hypothetical protein